MRTLFLILSSANFVIYNSKLGVEKIVFMYYYLIVVLQLIEKVTKKAIINLLNGNNFGGTLCLDLRLSM